MLREKPAPHPQQDRPSGYTSDPGCIGAWNPSGEKRSFSFDARTYEITGASLRETSQNASETMVLGVMADIKEDMPQNLANIQQIIEFFRKQQVEAVVVDGDLGESEAQIAHVLKAIVAPGWPVFAVIGNREGKKDFKQAMDAVSRAHPNLVNMNEVRLAQLRGLSLVSLPGYFNADYIHQEDGCQYLPQDAEATKEIIQAAGTDHPVVLVSHGPPLQQGPLALDRTLEQANVGSPSIAKLLESSGVRFGIFANIHESGGRATDLSGTQLVAPGTFTDQLYLNPGPTDSVSWAMNDGTRSVGMAAALTIKKKEGAFVSYRIPEPKDG